MNGVVKGNYRIVRIKKRKEENRESYMRHTGESETENGMREKMKERESGWGTIGEKVV